MTERIGVTTVPPRISVVVAPAGRGEALPGALAALAAQEDAPTFEVIVPVDATVEGLDALRARRPGARFLEVEGTDLLARSADIGVRHEAIDRRRAAGLAAARGEIIALTEEYARPAPDWCAQLAAVHGALPHAVIGGAIENAADRALNWAVFFGDAGRYQSPLPEGPAVFVSDVNVSYKRGPLYEAADTWRALYHETGLHDELRRRGHTLWLTPALVVRQDRGRLRLGDALRERYAWARLYAGRRVAGVPPLRRVLLAVGAPLLVALLPARQALEAWRRGSHRREFLRSLPFLLLMALMRSAGEVAGYITGRPARG
jgi:hypothetical protein